MFAVVDARGRVVAFSGRALAALPDDDPAREPPAKYINSPESPVYTKGSHLFGLWQGKHAIRQAERAILVEGNFDVVSLHARGVENVVAPLGTAFTGDQAKLLHRYAACVTLLFDGDAAGRKAALSAEDTCEEGGLDAEVAVLPDRADPDDFVRKNGVEALRYVVSNAKGLFEYIVDSQLDETFNAAHQREQLLRVDAVASRVARTKDAVQRALREAYADRAAGRLDIVRSAPNAFAAFKRKIMAAAQVTRVDYGPRPSEARVAAKPPGHAARKAIVEALLDFPVLLEDPVLQGTFELLEGESARIVSAMRRCTRVGASGEKRLDPSEFLAQNASSDPILRVRALGGTGVRVGRRCPRRRPRECKKAPCQRGYPGDPRSCPRGAAGGRRLASRDGPHGAREQPRAAAQWPGSLAETKEGPSFRQGAGRGVGNTGTLAGKSAETPR